MAYFLENPSHKNYKERKKERKKEGRKEGNTTQIKKCCILHTHIIAELLMGEGKLIRFLQETDLEIESNAINVMN